SNSLERRTFHATPDILALSSLRASRGMPSGLAVLPSGGEQADRNAKGGEKEKRGGSHPTGKEKMEKIRQRTGRERAKIAVRRFRPQCERFFDQSPRGL